MRFLSCLVASLAVALAGFTLAAGAGAATINVNTTADQYGDVTDRCSVREAVESANTNSAFGGCVLSGGGSDDVVKLHGGKTYTLTIPGIEDVNAGGDLDVIGALTMAVGGTGRATIDGGGLDRVLEVRPGGSLAASRLVFTGGSMSAGAKGGGVYNQGTLALDRSVVTANTIQAGLGAGLAAQGVLTTLDRTKVTKNVTVLTNSSGGGGIAQLAGTLKVRRSTIAGNTSEAGGGLYLTAEDNATVNASTISGNETTADQFGGGGVYAYDGMGPSPTIRFVNATISSNLSDGGGGGIQVGGVGRVELNATTVTANVADFDGDNAGFIAGSGGGVNGTVEVENSIIAGNVASNLGSRDCYPPPVNQGHNVVGRDAGCAGAGVGTMNPRLGPLRRNGGPTKTHALKRGSPAIGKAGGSAPPKDQRGVRRDADPDAGAYER